MVSEIQIIKEIVSFANSNVITDVDKANGLLSPLKKLNLTTEKKENHFLGLSSVLS